MCETEIIILFFGTLKRFFGESMTITLNKCNSIEDVLKILVNLKPEAFEILESCQFAVNETIVMQDYCISDKCELALLPPFSGG